MYYCCAFLLVHGGLICIALHLYGKKILEYNSLDINSYLENYSAYGQGKKCMNMC